MHHSGGKGRIRKVVRNFGLSVGPLILHAHSIHGTSFLMSVLLLIIIVLLVSFVWLLVSPVIMELDTKIPRAEMRWIGIGNLRIWYENEWWFSVRIFFYQKTMRISEMKPAQKKRRRTGNGHARATPPGERLEKIFRVLKTFNVVKWNLAIDTGDFVRNAQLYPLNHHPYAANHLFINFQDQNYLELETRNRPWKILFAFVR
jgi:hypothetical protein